MQICKYGKIKIIGSKSYSHQYLRVVAAKNLWYQTNAQNKKKIILGYLNIIISLVIVLIIVFISLPRVYAPVPNVKLELTPGAIVP